MAPGLERPPIPSTPPNVPLRPESIVRDNPSVPASPRITIPLRFPLPSGGVGGSPNRIPDKPSGPVPSSVEQPRPDPSRIPYTPTPVNSCQFAGGAYAGKPASLYLKRPTVGVPQSYRRDGPSDFWYTSCPHCIVAIKDTWSQRQEELCPPWPEIVGIADQPEPTFQEQARAVEEVKGAQEGGWESPMIFFSEVERKCPV